MVNIEGFINSTCNIGVLLTTIGLLSELRNQKENVSKCLIANGNIGLSLIVMGTTAKIYHNLTN